MHAKLAIQTKACLWRKTARQVDMSSLVTQKRFAPSVSPQPYLKRGWGVRGVRRVRRVLQLGC